MGKECIYSVINKSNSSLQMQEGYQEYNLAQFKCL